MRERRSGAATSDEARINALAGEGDVDSQIYLGWAYGKNGDLSYNPEAAERWLKKAAETGNVEAIRALARFLFDHNSPGAIDVTDRLIRDGDFYGHFLMAHALAKGMCGLKTDREKAIAHLRVGEELGHVVSGVDAMKLEYGVPILRPKQWARLYRLLKEWIGIWRIDRKDWRISR